MKVKSNSTDLTAHTVVDAKRRDVGRVAAPRGLFVKLDKVSTGALKGVTARSDWLRGAYNLINVIESPLPLF